MKKLILAVAVAAFSVGAFAGEGCCDKEKAAAPEKDKAAAGCPASKDAAKCPVTGATAKKDGEAKPAEAPKGDQKKS
ncbi:MAG: hypothetical protein QM813_17770 [Verrucomicrobiota bacterium]